MLNEGQIPWLLGRLNHIRRDVQSQRYDGGNKEVVFIILTENEENRRRVEGELAKYLLQRYGVVAEICRNKIESVEIGSTIHFPEATITLLDINQCPKPT